jgi:hypothetical protein
MENLLNPRQTADALGVAPRTIYDAAWRASIGLRCVRVGRLLRFRPTEIERVIDERSESAPKRGPA